MQIKYQINSKILLLSLLGVILVCSSYLIYEHNPLAMLINKLAALSPGSIFLSLWSNPPFEVFIKIYIYNVTNAKAFLDGKETLNVSQIGPYTYQEILTNNNATFNANGTMTFAPKRALVFRRDKSVGDPSEDVIISPNIPLIGISASLQEASMLTNLAVSTISNVVGAKPFLNLTITEYLWGYDDRLVTLANKAIPNWINFERFGIMDRLMALDNASNIVTLNTHPENGLASKLLQPAEQQNKYHIHRWNGSPGMRQWGYVDRAGNETAAPGNCRCNMVEGSFEGTIFPPNLQENSTFKMYRRAFCRPVPMNYERKVTTKDGFDGFLYRVDQQFLATAEENPDNACYCLKGKCLRKGLGNLAPCYYDIPIVISQPHFLNSDPWLLEQVSGLAPDKERHDSTLILHPGLGVPLWAELRIQINLDVGQTKYNSRTRVFNGLVLPLFWLELTIEEVPPVAYHIVNLLFHVLPMVQKLAIYLLGLVGLALISGSALLAIVAPRRSLNGRLSFSGEYSPIPVIPIPIASQYFKPDIRICK